MQTPILILAAGASSRMRGRDKLAEPVGGEALLTRIARIAAEVSPVVLVALPSADHPRLALLRGLPVTPLVVPEAAEGLSGTLRGAVARLPDCARFLVLLADLPELTSDDLMTVLRAGDAHPGPLIWRGATEEGAPGHPILFDASLRPDFAHLAGDSGGEAIIRARRDRTMLIPLPGQHARLDLDTPEDWAAWRAGRS